MNDANLDFYLLPRTDRNKLVLIDVSTYLEPATTPIMSITLPGFKNLISLPFTPSSVNSINTSLLGLSSLGTFNEFGDGVYKFSYSICPNDSAYITKFYLLDNNFHNLYADKLSEYINNDCSDAKVKNKLNEIDNLITGAHIQAERNNPIIATDWYNRAFKMISKLNCMN